MMSNKLIPSERRWRQLLEHALELKLSERAWSVLVQDGHVADAIAGAIGIDELRAIAEQHLSVNPPTQRSPRMRDSVGEPGGEAFNVLLAASDLLALDAAQDELVVAFRAAAGGTVRREDVAAWVARQAKVDGPPSVIMEITDFSAQDTQPSMLTARPRLGPNARIIGRHRRYLSYLTVPGDSVSLRPVHALGVLDRLRDLSDVLATTYGWNVAQAATFVLTGVAPLIAPIRMTTEVRPAAVVRPRIVMDIDPTTSPEQVAREYRNGRKDVLPGFRRLSAQHALLRVFTAERHSVNRRGQMLEWNAAYPLGHTWHYERIEDFRRDARTVEARPLRRF